MAINKEKPLLATVFPLFLLPLKPFYERERKPALDTKISTTQAKQSSEIRQNFLEDYASYIRCARCGTDICFASQVISKGFTGRHGRAYLVSADSTTSAISMTSTSCATTSLPNTITQKAVHRQLATGIHTVCDISCVICGSVLGWKYVAAEEESQRYKVGKFILETKRISVSSCWEPKCSSEPSVAISLPFNTELFEEVPRGFLNEVEFDSQDEDECEDLFAGIWAPDLAARRRWLKVGQQGSP